jgi:hypothetical protein
MTSEKGFGTESDLMSKMHTMHAMQTLVCEHPFS